MDAVRASDEFRWGVSAYHAARFGEAVITFERALSYNPDDLRIIEWLGSSYYRLGYEDSALSLWNRVLDAGAASGPLQYLIDTIEWRRGVSRDLVTPSRYVEIYSLEGQREEFDLFLRPSSILARGDGGYYVVSFASNQVLQLNANSAIQRRILGGVSGLDHPFDIVEIEDGRLFITEFLRHEVYRTDRQGFASFRFGERGTQEGQLLGPQYMAIDGRGYLYVTESGNRRVSKFDYDGNFVLSFGDFETPTGIVVHRELVFVCDVRRRSISVFDLSGNFIREIGLGLLDAPEGISVYSDGVLLVADTTSIKLLDIENEAVVDFGVSSESSKFTKAVIGANQNILVSDFGSNAVSMYTDITALYSGLLVEITSVNSNDFPNIVAEVRVQTRDGSPLIGLDESNFILTERSGTLEDAIILDVDPTQKSRLAVVIEDSARIDLAAEIIESSLADLTTSLGNAGGLSLYRAGVLPLFVGRDGTAATLASRLREASTTSDDWRLDSGLKLAGAELTSLPGSRAIVIVTTGTLGTSAFDEYPPDILATYFRNNDIIVYSVFIEEEPEDREVFEYLAEETGGETYSIYRAKGIGEIADLVLDASTGRYFFQYVSQSQSNFGTAYIPVEAEVFYYRRTGRGGSAYFPPLE